MPPKRIYFYQRALVKPTFLQTLLAIFDIELNDVLHDIRRKSVLHAFQILNNLPESDSPRFVFAHILCPHSPFVFGKDGSKVSNKNIPFSIEEQEKHNQPRSMAVTAYIDQMQYLNTLIMETVDVILARSKTPPIIIIQGDHGPQTLVDWNDVERSNVVERHSILNAYYVPEELKESLYPSISPVNSFRVVFNYLFNTDYKLLPERHYFCDWHTPFQLTDVTNRVRAE